MDSDLCLPQAPTGPQEGRSASTGHYLKAVPTGYSGNLHPIGQKRIVGGANDLAKEVRPARQEDLRTPVVVRSQTTGSAALGLCCAPG